MLATFLSERSVFLYWGYSKMHLVANRIAYRRVEPSKPWGLTRQSAAHYVHEFESHCHLKK